MSALSALKDSMSETAVKMALLVGAAVLTLAPDHAEARAYQERQHEECIRKGERIGEAAGGYAAAGNYDARRLASMLVGVVGGAVATVICDKPDTHLPPDSQDRRKSSGGQRF